MGIKYYIILVLLFLLTGTGSLALAKKEVVYFGGGGEPKNRPDTIFDRAYLGFGLFSKESGWAARSYFDGGHSHSEQRAQQLFKGENKSMTTQNVSQEIATLKARLESGDLRNGDQVLLTLATHGLKKSENQISHNVTTTDGEFNVDELVKLRDLAEKKGVALAILDFSCYSGNSLKLGTDKTCVISASSDAVIAYNRTGDLMGRALKKGLSLEEVFLKTRDAEGVAAAPQISTTAGLKAHQVTRVLSEAMKSRSSLAGAAAEDQNCLGSKSNSFKKLARHIVDVERSSSWAQYLKVRVGLAESKYKPLLDKLENAVDKYTRSRTLAEKELQEIERSRCFEVRSTRLCGEASTWANWHKVLTEKDAKNELASAEKAELADYRKIVNHPDFKRLEYLEKEFSKRSDLLDEANEVAKVEREVYQMLYEDFSRTSNKPNPCRDFKL